MTSPVRAVLFDLDGTLIDSAPDLAATANEMRQARGLAPLPFAQLRPMVGAGARGMLGVALQVTPEQAEFAELRDEFLRRYEQRMTRETRPFDAVPALLDSLEARGLRWGIVTNKIERFTLPLVQSFGWTSRSGAVVGGDTTPHPKPHPAPLLEAARRIGIDPSACVYVGDDLRDIQAGQAAGMRTIAVAWGYLGAEADITTWKADHMIAQPAQLLNLLAMA